MNPRPVTLPAGLEREEVVRFFQTNPRASIPLVDARGRIRGLAQMSEHLAQALERPNAVVLMAGGKGRRLRPLTLERPKPLLPVGDRPILETIVGQLASAGFKRFFLAVNHQAGQIRRHFGDGSRLGVRVDYLHERAPLGTAGALSMLPEGLKDPLIVMNGDLLTKIDFKALLDFHTEEGNLATLCVREYDFQVPFGVVSMAGHRLERIVEKPTQRCFVNAGIYILEPRALRLVPKGRPFDMPDLLKKAQARRAGSVGCFPVREYWIDIGRIDEYRKANAEFPETFE